MLRKEKVLSNKYPHPNLLPEGEETFNIYLNINGHILIYERDLIFFKI